MTIDQWLFRPIPMHAMVCCRILLGLSLSLAYGLEYESVEQLFGSQGINGYATFERIPGHKLTVFPHLSGIAFLHLLSNDTIIWLLYLTLVSSAAAFALGLFTRTSGLVALSLHIIFHNHNHYVYTDWAWMIRYFVFYTILADTGKFFSIDAWRRHPGSGFTFRSCRGPAWPTRLLQLHLCTMYAVAALNRIDSPAWLSGDMTFVLLSSSRTARFNLDVSAVTLILHALTYMSLLLELAAPVLLWFRKTGKYFAVALTGMHLCMELFLQTGWWQYIMIAALFAFYPPQWFFGAQRWLGERAK